MNKESKLIELFKKYPGIAARIRRSFAYHAKIPTLQG